MSVGSRKLLLPRGLCLLISYCLSFGSSAQADNNITIEEAKEIYLFSRVRGEDGVVKVEVSSTTTFLCNDYRTTIPIEEHYSDQLTIDKVSIYTDGRYDKDIKPVYDYKEDQSVFFWDVKRCRFTVPFEKKGVTGTVVLEKTIRDPIHFPPILLTDTRPIKKKTVQIMVPDWMSVEFKEMNFDGWNIVRSQERRNDGIAYTFTIQNARAVEGESRAPGWSYYVPHILVLPKESHLNGITKTYFKTVADQYAWYKNLIDSIGNDEAPVHQKALEIVAGKTTDEEKVKAVYHWVQQNIRYIAYEDGIAGYRPKKAQEVLAKKYGDCKGMANLLVVMLRSLGYDARHCWLGTNHLAYDYSTPSLLVDNHMIAAWMRNGKPEFLDGTETYIRFGETAERIQGRQVLIENGNGYLLANVPKVHHDQNTAIEARQLHFEGNDLAGKVVQTYHGESREYVLELLHDVKLDRRDEVLRNYLSGNNDNYQISNLVISDPNDYDGELKVTYDVLQKGALSKFGAENYLDLDNRKRFAAYRLDTSKRHLPICFPFKDHQVLDIRITLPTGATVKSLPGAAAVTSADYGYSGTWTNKEGELSYHSESWIEKTTFPLNEFAGLNKDVQSVQTFYNAQPELRF